MNKAARLEQQILEKVMVPLTPYGVLKAAREVLIPLIDDDHEAVALLTSGHCRSWKDLHERAKFLWREDNPILGDAFIGAEFSCRARSKSAREQARVKRISTWWDEITICRLCWRPAPGGKVKPTCYLHGLEKNPTPEDRREYQKSMRAYDEYKKQLAIVKESKRRSGFRLAEGQHFQNLVYIANTFPFTVGKFIANDWLSLLDSILGIKEFNDRKIAPSEPEKAAILKLKNSIIANPNSEIGWLVQAEAWLRAYDIRRHGGKRR